MPQDIFPHGGLVPGSEDLEVTPLQLLSLPHFSSVNASKLGRCQGAMVLRFFPEPGKLICQQGAAGMSAYFILSEADVYGLYAYVEAKLQDTSASANPDEELQSDIEERQAIRDKYRAKLPFLQDAGRLAALKAAHEANMALAQRGKKDSKARPFLSATAQDKRAFAEQTREKDQELAALLLAAAAGQDDRPAASVSRHTLRESSKATSSNKESAGSLLVRMYERELFGEMACRNRKPRAADVYADRPCYVLELLSNVLAILEEDRQLKEDLQNTYQRRILELHLRDLSLFRHLSEAQFLAFHDRFRTHLSVVSKKAGEAICKEGDPSDAVYLIRQGWVQVRQESPPHVVAYRGPGEFIGELALIQTEEQLAALKRADFTGVLKEMPKPGPRTATCMAWGHPDGKGEVELVHIFYEEFWELLQAYGDIRNEVAAEIEHRRAKTLPMSPVPEVEGQANELFANRLQPLGLYQGQALMLIDLDRCTHCDECVQACISAHGDGYSRLALVGPRAVVDSRLFLVPTTCQSCEDPVCMIGCPTRAIRRGDIGEMIIKADACIGCGKCANNCPYNAIQMHDLGLISSTGDLNPRISSTKEPEKEYWPSSDGWYCFPAKDIDELAWASRRKQKKPPRGWLACSLPLDFDRAFCDDLAAAARRRDGGKSITPAELLYFWRAFTTPFDEHTGGGQIVLEVESAVESLKVWIDGEEIAPTKSSAKSGKSEYEHHVSPAARKTWSWWRRDHTHVLALQVVPSCEPWDTFLHMRLYAVRPPRGPWDILDDITEKTRKPRLAVVCDLCHTHSGGPSCIQACPHDATRRFPARRGLIAW